MLLCQFMVIAWSAVKRFDAVVLLAWESVREAVASALSFEGDSETDLG
jgi:hypothetical protein